MTCEGHISADIQWRRISAEGVAITASILLAFAIDAAWDTRGARTEEQAVLGGLHRELVDNAAALSVSTERIEDYVAGLRALIEVSPTTLAAMSDSSATGFMETLGGSRLLQLQLAQIESAVNSGDLALIRNREVRRQLSLWRDTADQLVVQAEGATDRRLALVETANDHGVWSSAATHGALPAGWGAPLGLSVPSLGDALAAARADERFTEDAVMLYAIYQVLLRDVSEAEAVLESLISELVGEIESA